MKLESQIEKLADLGLPLNEDITIDDFLLSWSRAEYEESPFDLILFTYGNEVEEAPWGRYICDRAWNFDAECIVENGDYVEIVRQFHRITGEKRQLENLSDHIDLESSKASLQYTVDGVERKEAIKVDNDWADPKTVAMIMGDMEEKGFDFYGKDNGQATVWFYMTLADASVLNSLANNVFGLEKNPWWKVW